MKKLPLFCLFILFAFLSACSSFKTNTNISFDSADVGDQKPALFVGNIKETPDKLTYLGWVEAKIKKPIFGDGKPNQQQADIILAHQAKKMGADAVTHITYKIGFGSVMFARGQAVKIKGKKKPTRISSKSIQMLSLDKDDPLSAITQIKTLIPPKEAVKNRTQEDLLTQAQILTEALSLTLKQAKKNAQASRFLNDTMDEQRESMGYMLSNANFLLKQAKASQDNDMKNSAQRLLDLLEDYSATYID